MRLPNDNAQVVYTGSDKFAAFVERYPDGTAVVLVYGKPTKHDIDFKDVRADYETASRGATESARREVRRLEKQA